MSSEMRELIAKWRSEVDGGPDRELKEIGYDACLLDCADELATLIAELGQEVGAVEDERLCDFFADVGEVEQFMDDLCNVVTELTGDEGEDDPITVLRRYIASSPAHTSEARDAEIDDAALDIARRFTLDTEPQRRASLQVAIVEAMHRASNRSQS